MTEPVKSVGRNEPCPCKSGKKYKRCCGVSAAPKLTTPAHPISMDAGEGGENANPFANMDPQVMMQFSQALQRLPKGQLQRLQGMMQRAMNGRDVTAEAQEFEKSLPPDFQQMLQSFQTSMGGMGMGAGDANMPALGDVSGLLPNFGGADHSASTNPPSNMTEEQARELVAQAAAAGTISKEQAAALLKMKDSQSGGSSNAHFPLGSSTPVGSEASGDPAAAGGENEKVEGAILDKSSKLGKFWKNLSGKNT